jgi:hypothetical protein
MLMSACAGASSAAADVSGGGDKVQPAPVEFTGMVESIVGDQWTVNGQTITVDPAVVRDGPFNVGDTVKVEVDVQPDGSLVVTRVETPEAPAAPEAEASETPETSETPESVSTPDATTAGIVFDDGGTEAFGTVDSIDGNTVVIGGQTFQIETNAEFKDQIAAGNFVKVHFMLNADGSLSVTEIELSDPSLVEDDSSDDDVNDDDANDDHGDDQDDDDSQDDDADEDQDDDSGSDDGDDNSGSGS